MRHVITYKFILCMDILFKNIDILSKTSTCALWDKAHVNRAIYMRFKRM